MWCNDLTINWAELPATGGTPIFSVKFMLIHSGVNITLIGRSDLHWFQHAHYIPLRSPIPTSIISLKNLNVFRKKSIGTSNSNSTL